MSEPARNFWHVEIAPPQHARNKRYRALVRLEDRERTRAEAKRAVHPAAVTKMSQRCTGQRSWWAGRCRRYVVHGHRCRFHEAKR